jgi:hypothetical protein
LRSATWSSATAIIAPIAIGAVALLSSRDRFSELASGTLVGCGRRRRGIDGSSASRPRDRLAYIKRGGRKKRIAADHLVVDGIFAHVRHPLYVGNFLLLVAS